MYKISLKITRPYWPYSPNYFSIVPGAGHTVISGQGGFRVVLECRGGHATQMGWRGVTFGGNDI